MKKFQFSDGRWIRSWVVMSSYLAITLPGCASSRSQEPQEWSPSPRITWSDVVPVRAPEMEEGYRLLRTAPTRGLFPASIGVTRVAYAAPTANNEGMELRLTRDPRNEFLQWNRAFDDQMAVSEVFPIDERDLAGGEADSKLILAAFRALEARIGLIYAVNELAQDKTEMIGALYEVKSGDPIASIHASATSIPTEETDIDEDNLWRTDSRALVRTAFANHVYQCIRELISRDRPGAVESPEGWTPAGPTMPVEWPPRF